VPGDLSPVVADLDYPMTVVTCAADGRRAGCLVGFASQCSIRPPLVTVWVSAANHTHDLARVAAHMAVHWLSVEQGALAELFGSETGDDVDKFARCRWRTSDHGAPVLEDCGRWFVGRVMGQRPTGDHRAFLLEPVETHAGPAWPGQLGYQAVRDLDPGHLP
jgi:flavin reductase (DIM6/NTAB) family NADH-FMN oxidoreductase RutF